ncbi:hypothetical protein DYH55_21745 [Methylovirgula sp. 4M-Z18]|nr:hypothetical protein DYH55_21745 [Methylovirgula sp. 4M-Z18]
MRLQLTIGFVAKIPIKVCLLRPTFATIYVPDINSGNLTNPDKEHIVNILFIRELQMHQPAARRARGAWQVDALQAGLKTFKDGIDRTREQKGSRLFRLQTIAYRLTGPTCERLVST